MFKNILFSIINFITSLLIANIFITILSYFNIINNSLINILNFIIPIILITINSFILGTKTNKLGLIEGLKFGSIISILFLIINIITKNNHYKTFIYYIIIVLTSLLSSIIGINKKKNT